MLCLLCEQETIGFEIYNKRKHSQSLTVSEVLPFPLTNWMKTWPGDLPVGILGDLQAMISSVTGRGEFTFHIGILGLSEVCAVS